jgi:hypothetical protein
LDESEDAASSVYVVGGFVGKAEVWKELERCWAAAMPTGISVFHASDCFSGSNQFEGMDIPERVALLNEVTNVIVAHEVQLVGYGIDAKTYKKVAPKAKQNEFLGNRYAAPFGGAVELACKSIGNMPGPLEVFEILDYGEQCEKCAFFIEGNEYSPSAKRVIEDMRLSRELWFRNRIGPDYYAGKTGPAGMPLLQVADWGAFLAAKYISKTPNGKIAWQPYYDKLKSAGRVYGTVLADEYSVTVLYKLHEELKAENAEGRNYWDDI